ncbi:myelin-associated glycoprotein isoform X2 [Haplochromis burtoni]|uniref:myelin-associated glycoprotein isoform X2 n=1 Tax=Haplochromis burtoni TaxID=8153 RepID=UPI001C2CD128|nr:myelin-associated glycoprotein isoform X2 [Haplochromis burtoni]
MASVHLLRLLSLMTVLQQVKGFSVRVPKTVVADEGTCVVVPCQTEPYNRVIWYQYHNLKYPVVYDGVNSYNVEQQFRGRTKVSGNAAEGNCTLMIDNVSTADHNLRVYVWINPDSQTTQTFHDQTVTISVERKAPIIYIQKKMVEGENFQANCSIIYSCPFLPPSLQWNANTLLENYTFVDFHMEVHGQWFYQKTLRGVATYLMHNRRIRCSAKFKTFTIGSEMTLNILYKPVTVTVKKEKKVVVEGDSINIECVANSNPPPHKYLWFIRQLDQHKIKNSTQSTKHFNNIARDTSLSCMAQNAFGVQQSVWVDLDVQYRPVILPETSCHLKGDLLRCICLVDASPNASIYWIINGNYTHLSSFTSALTNKKHVVFGEIKIKVKTQTNVSCTGRNPHGSDTKKIPAVSLSESSLLLWLMLPGMIFLFGCAVLIYRKYPVKRLFFGGGHVQQQQINNIFHRSQNEDTQIHLQRPDRDLEMERLSCVYDNDFLEEMQRSARSQHYQNSETLLQSKNETEPPDEVLPQKILISSLAYEITLHVSEWKLM